MERAKKLAGWSCLCVLGAFLAVALLPAPYCGPAVDDFGYGAPVYYALKSGLGLPGFLAALWENVRYTYENWQGTFASVLLFSVQPGVFSDALYPLTPAVMLTMAAAPAFLALGAVKGMERWGRWVVGALVALVSVEYLPSPGQGLYWWNGGSHYLAFWFLSVLTFTLQLRLSRRRAGGGRFWAEAAVCWVLAFLVGGGNYSTALVFPLFSGALTVYYMVYDRRGRRVAAANAATALWAAAGLAISMAAPGNAIRQEMKFTGMSPAAAILGSFRCALTDLGRRLDWPVLCALVTAAAVFLLAAGKSGHRFPLPLLVVAGGFCAYSALYTPALYAMGVEWTPPRMENLTWLASLFFAFGSVLYLAGWAARRFALLDRPAAPKLLSALGWAGALALALTLALGFGRTNAAMALSDLRTGVLEEYRQARQTRQAVWEDKSVGPVRFQSAETIPTPKSFMPAGILTWSADVLVDGTASEFPCCRACGCEVNFVPIRRAMAFLGSEEPWSEEEFPITFRIGGEIWAPLRAVTDRLGCQVSYDLPTDTITILTHPRQEAGHGAG